MNAKERFARNILEPKTIPQLEESLRKLESKGLGMGDMAILARQVLAEKRLQESRQ
jgi:hypothetical protein